MSRKQRKQLHDEIYRRCIGDYKYDSGYDPYREMCFDSALDKELAYGTVYPNHDNNDYSAHQMREYNNTEEK